jgi:tetratricopeptide (TPR) repeat protein
VKLLNDGTEKAKSRVMAKAYQLRGSLYSERKKFGKALTEYLKAKDIMIELYGPNSLQMTDVYIDLSKIYLEQEDPQKAIRYYKHATELNESYFGILDFKMVEFYSNLAILYL